MTINQFLLVWTAVCSLGVAAGVLMFVRNEWVYRERRKLADTPDYARLPTYTEMLRRWWVWDIKKFL